MKAEKVIGIAACAFACVTSSAFANTTNGWFGVKVENDVIIHPNCATNGAAVAIEEGKIKLEDATLAIDHFSNAPTSDGIVKISATASLTPNSTNDLYSSDALENAKAGFAVGVDDLNATNFYGYASNSWHKLTGVTPGAGETSFSMILNYRDKVVSFYVDDVLLASADDLTLDASSLVAIDASGSGSITSITGAYEVAVAAYGGKKYGSIAEASDAAKAAIPEVDPTTVVEVVKSDGTTEGAGTSAANGLSKIVCEALGLSMNDSTANIAVAPAATDEDVDEITLAVNLPINAEPDAVGFVINGAGKVYDADAIKIPLEAGIYTITPVLK